MYQKFGIGSKEVSEKGFESEANMALMKLKTECIPLKQ
jgi:hypothetical protein